MLSQYPLVNNALAIVTYDTFLCVFEDYSPIKVVVFDNTDFSTSIDSFDCPADMANITDVYADVVNQKIYVVCNTSPAKLFIINIQTDSWSSSELVTSNPTHIEIDGTYIYISTAESPARIELRFLDNYAYVQTLTLTENQSYQLAKDVNGDVWGVCYTVNGTGKVFRINHISLDVTYFDIENIDKLYTLNFDSEGALWVGSQNSPGQIAKCILETGDVLSSTITTLNTGENEVSNIVLHEDYQITILEETLNVLEILQNTGDDLEWSYENIANFETGDVIPNNYSLVNIGVSLATFRQNILYIISFSHTSKIITDFRYAFSTKKICRTVCEWSQRVLKKISTSCIFKVEKTPSYKTDCRWRVYNVDYIPPKSFASLIVKKDETELLDVDYNSVRIDFHLDNNPSSATFLLGRRHDNIDKTLNGISSIISQENKITILDGVKLLFTGYITKINPSSENDMVSIIAEDCRYKLKNHSMELEYGGKYGKYDEEDEDEKKKIIAISTKEALESVFLECATLISGYEPIPFSFVPPYSKSYGDCASFIDTLVRDSGTFHWYTDENEKVCFQQVGKGNIKTLSLSGINTKRNLYDIIINNITLNKQHPEYATQFEIKLGKYNKIVYRRETSFTGKTTHREDTQFMAFTFQKSHSWLTELVRYTGMGDSAYGFAITTDTGWWGMEGYFVFQWQEENSNEDLPKQTIGIPGIRRTVDYSSYGRRTANEEWIEKELSKPWSLKREIGGFSYPIEAALYYRFPELYDQRDFAIDAATLELNQNNKLITEANIQIVLDAYEHYDLKFNNRINISNTIDPGIYRNSNGFPLNIENISIDFSTKIVTISLTNYGQTFYKRTGNIMNHYHPEIDLKGLDRLKALIVTNGITQVAEE